ncbi:glycosyltransferase [Niabella hibiscisoli]|uniref:glycosyltransferase n=1 Tax=Niabella hibiscisoli TaxID=1825928 RepID=UPI001F10B590|nr:glycosyltransferase [Niabella hibiscisoli]MCH5716246.1 hypothetical protein [Niabella hibiscisoli]
MSLLEIPKTKNINSIMISNRIIQSLWVGGPLNPLALLCINSYLFHGHEFHLYVYEKIEVPKGIILRDATNILPQHQIFKDKYGSYAAFSDWFRYELLYKYGGWWTDMDVVCLKHFNTEEDYAFATELFGIDNCVVATSNIKVPPKSKLMEDCLDAIQKIEDLPSINWFEIGAHLLSEKICKNSLEDYIRDPNVFTPISLSTSEILFQNSYIKFSNLTYSVHFYNNKLRTAGFDLYKKFHHNSLYERLKKKYCTEKRTLLTPAKK